MNIATIANFGITVPCYPGDVDLLSGCLSSIAEHYPGTPICLIPHGNFSLSGFIKRYGCSFIDPAEIDPTLRRSSYGYGLTKMIAFWHAPFEYFLHIDADAVCWGRFFEPDLFQEFDFISNTSHEEVTDTLLFEQYFNHKIVKEQFCLLEIDRNKLFNSGTFGAKRGILDQKLYSMMLETQRKFPNSFFMDQGVLNAMVQLGVRDRTLRYTQRNLQTVVAVSDWAELEKQFSFSQDRPSIGAEKLLIHWAGPKPRAGRKTQCDYSRPMDYYRLKHFGLERLVSTPGVQTGLHIAGEVMIFKAKLENRFHRTFARPSAN
jgi:hypothetical protein